MASADIIGFVTSHFTQSIPIPTNTPKKPEIKINYLRILNTKVHKIKICSSSSRILRSPGCEDTVEGIFLLRMAKKKYPNKNRDACKGVANPFLLHHQLPLVTIIARNEDDCVNTVGEIAEAEIDIVDTFC
jgi:hypothetical protein